jgi:hypothetical protein
MTTATKCKETDLGSHDFQPFGMDLLKCSRCELVVSVLMFKNPLPPFFPRQNKEQELR